MEVETHYEAHGARHMGMEHRTEAGMGHASTRKLGIQTMQSGVFHTLVFAQLFSHTVPVTTA